MAWLAGGQAAGAGPAARWGRAAEGLQHSLPAHSPRAPRLPRTPAWPAALACCTGIPRAAEMRPAAGAPLRVGPREAPWPPRSSLAMLPPPALVPAERAASAGGSNGSKRLLMGRDGGGSRRGCGFCLRWSQSCLCPGSSGKMLGGLLLRLLLATALCPGLRGTGTAPLPLLLLPEPLCPGPAGASSLVGCSPVAAGGGLCREVVVGAGDGGPGVVVPELVPLQRALLSLWGGGERGGGSAWGDQGQPGGFPLPSAAITLLACVCPCWGNGERWRSQRQAWGQGCRRAVPGGAVLSRCCPSGRSPAMA